MEPPLLRPPFHFPLFRLVHSNDFSHQYDGQMYYRLRQLNAAADPETYSSSSFSSSTTSSSPFSSPFTPSRSSPPLPWKSTPYNLYTTSPSSLSALSTYRTRHTTLSPSTALLIVIDPISRMRDGYPIIRLRGSRRYNPSNPYRYDAPHAFFRDVYICPARVKSTPTPYLANFSHSLQYHPGTSNEVVGIWNWEHLARNRDWWKEVVMPAYEMFRRLKESAEMGPLRPVYEEASVSWENREPGNENTEYRFLHDGVSFPDEQDGNLWFYEDVMAERMWLHIGDMRKQWKSYGTYISGSE